MLTNITASAATYPLAPVVRIVTEPPVPALNEYCPRRFHRPPLVCWFTTRVAVPPLCVISTGTLLARLAPAEYQM